MSVALTSVRAMELLLIPGLWLDASSWDAVTPALRDAGHHPLPLTLPGVGESASDVGMVDWVAAVVDQIDRAEGPVVLVGHSGGGNVVWGATDARPERVARVILVDTVPPAPGQSIGEFDVADGAVPFPGWAHFPAAEVADLDQATRERTALLARSVPARVPTDPIELQDDRRFTVPVTLLMGSFDQASFEAEIAHWGPYADEFAAITDAEVVTLGSGHWPQFSMPQRLAEQIVAAIER